MRKVIALLLALCLLLTGCAGKPSQSDDLMANVKPSGEKKDFLTIDNGETETYEFWDNALVGDFALRLFRASFEDGKNVLISPYSVLTALSMTTNGAEGNTLAQMEKVLGQPSGALNSWYRFGMAENDFLHLANGIWFKDDPALAVKEEFLQINAEYFGAEVHKAPFDKTTLAEINNFVKKNTDGMVKDILNEIPEEAVMYLVNALAFEAKWEQVYDEGQVSPDTFTMEDGTKQDMELMWSEEHLYYENDLCAGFQKPYLSRDRFAFVALLPKEGVTMESLLEGLEENGMQHFLASPQEATVETAIPKFEVEFDTEMSNVLTAMGMTDAFDPEAADFSRLGVSTNGNLYISQVLHKTYIAVAEQGTKAGAATAVAVPEGAAAPVEMKQVILNRPFLYMIVDTESNTPVFMGALMDMA